MYVTLLYNKLDFILLSGFVIEAIDKVSQILTNFVIEYCVIVKHRHFFSRNSHWKLWI